MKAIREEKGISLQDINEIVEIDLVNGKIQLSKKKPDVEMNSKSLYLIFTQGYGYDTLTVNGCFEELNNNGFVKMTQSLALGNLNNMGVFPFSYTHLRANET